MPKENKQNVKQNVKIVLETTPFYSPFRCGLCGDDTEWLGVSIKMVLGGEDYFVCTKCYLDGITPKVLKVKAKELRKSAKLLKTLAESNLEVPKRDEFLKLQNKRFNELQEFARVNDAIAEANLPRVLLDELGGVVV